MAEPSVLLTVSGAIPPDLDDAVAAGERPRADYREIAAAAHADVVDVSIARARSGRVGAVLQRAGGAGLLLAWHCFRRRNDYDVVVTDGEQVGLPLALLCRAFGRGTARHVMIVHVLSVPKKYRLMRITRIARLIDRYIVYCSAQRDFITERLGADPSSVVLSTFMVDTRFFSPESVSAPKRRMICSAGLERRDYPTLMSAVAGLDVEVVIAAASPWSKQADSSAGQAVPDNVEILRLSLFELRALYAEAAFVVMPLVDVDFQAGITTILEAMSMGLPVVCTRTPGQTDTIRDGVTGVYVPIGDAPAFGAAITALLDEPPRLTAMGAAARDWAVANADVERYASAIADVIRDVSDVDGDGDSA